jgi:hypothetical protein
MYTVLRLEVLFNLSEVFLTLTEVFPLFFLSCKVNARVKLAKMGRGPYSSTLVVICVVRLLFVLFCVLFVCKCVLPPGDNPTAVNKYIICHNAWQAVQNRLVPHYVIFPSLLPFPSLHVQNTFLSTPSPRYPTPSAVNPLLFLNSTSAIMRKSLCLDPTTFNSVCKLLLCFCFQIKIPQTQA